MSILRYNRPNAKAALLRGELPGWIAKHNRSDYIRRCVLSFPPWVDRKALQELWRQARLKEFETGKPYVLDHIVPVTHPLTSGLTVPWNLQVIPADVNARKSNTWAPDQMRLF